MSNQQDRQMTEDEVIAMQAQQCVDFARQIDAILEGKDLETCLIVLIRLAATAASNGGIPPQQLVNHFLNVVADTYELDKKVKEKTQ